MIRSGYGISYIRTPLYLLHMFSSYQPDALATTVTEDIDVAAESQHRQDAITTTQTPLFTEPLNGLRSQSVYSFQSNLRTPYTQNFNFSIQREITPTTLLTVAYVGNVGDKLLRAYDVNEINILAPSPDGESFLQAYNTVRAGGDSKFMDSLVSGLGLTSTSMRLEFDVPELFRQQ